MKTKLTTKDLIAAGAFGALINTVLDPVFIFKFGMGVKGAALATVYFYHCVCGMPPYLYGGA